MTRSSPSNTFVIRMRFAAPPGSEIIPKYLRVYELGHVILCMKALRLFEKDMNKRRLNGIDARATDAGYSQQPCIRRCHLLYFEVPFRDLKNNALSKG